MRKGLFMLLGKRYDEYWNAAFKFCFRKRNIMWVSTNEAALWLFAMLGDLGDPNKGEKTLQLGRSG